MDLAGELENRGLEVHVNGQWMGSCFFPDDIILLASSAQELQSMLDVAAGFARRWYLRFNPKVRCANCRTEEAREEKVALAQ